MAMLDWWKLFKGRLHNGTIDFIEPNDIPPLASRPAPFNPARDEELWQEFIDLDTRPSPLFPRKDNDRNSR